MNSEDILNKLFHQSADQNIEMLQLLPPERELQPGLSVSVVLEQNRLRRAPAPPSPGCCLRSDVVYGSAGTRGRNLTTHLYIHEDSEKRPGIVFIHGGGWAGGHPNVLSRIASEMSAAGYVTASISYRLSGEAHWPAALEDAKCAVRWMRAHAADIGVDPSKIVVAGESAGGHLAAMVALIPGRFEGTGGWEDESSEVQAAVLYSPGLDLRKSHDGSEGVERFVLTFLGNADFAVEASPICQITSTCPPVLTRVGDQDEAAPASIARSFHSALDEAGVTNELEIISHMGHGLPARDHVGCVHATANFLADHL